MSEFNGTNMIAEKHDLKVQIAMYRDDLFMFLHICHFNIWVTSKLTLSIISCQ